MKRAIACLGFMTALVTLCGAVAYAAQQTLPTQRFQVVGPNPANASKRRMRFFTNAQPPPAYTLNGNPSLNGAKLHVRLASGADQCFDLPAASWSVVSGLGQGYMYRDLDGPGAVSNFQLLLGPQGTLKVKMKVSGRRGPLNILPQAGNAGFDLNFNIVGGDEYCAGGATPPGSANNDNAYKVKNVPAPPTCGVAACSPSGAFLD